MSGAANNYVVSPVTVNNRDAFDTRGDQNFSDKDKFFLRYSYYKLYFYNPGPLPPPLVGSTNFQQSINNQSGHQAALGETHVFSGTLVNDFRAGYNRISNALKPFVSDDIDAQFGIGYIPPHPGMTGLPNITISGYSNLGEAAFLPDAKGSDTFQLTDSLLWSKGKHYIKTGGEYRWVSSRFDILANARGLFDFNWNVHRQRVLRLSAGRSQPGNPEQRTRWRPPVQVLRAPTSTTTGRSRRSSR